MNKTTLHIKTGLLYGLLATTLWGSYPLWYKPLHSLNSLNAYNLLAWRIIFAELFLIIFIISSKRVNHIKAVFTSIKYKHIFLVSFILGLWWWLYIYGIMANRILEVAFGYFLSPIMSMAIARLILKEKTTKIQKLAIIVAICGVCLMAVYLLNIHTFPWIAIIIGFCYSFYGIFKKKVSGDPIIIQAMEVFILLPFAILFMIYSYRHGNGHVFMQNFNIDLLLMATGVITVLPLWWYSQAAKNLTVITLSFIQFIPPTLTFLLGYFIYEEQVQMMQLQAFFLIWLALAIFIYNLFNSKIGD